MIFQDWILPIFLSVIWMDFGIVWALRLRKSSSTRGLLPSRVLPVPVERHAEWRYRFLSLLMGVGISILSWLSYPNLYPRAKWAGLCLLGVGVLWVIYSFVTIRHGDQVFHWLAEKFHTSPTQMVLLVGAISLVLVAGVSSVYSNHHFNQSLATFSWGLGVLAVILGGWGSEKSGQKPNWQHVLWFTVLTGVAFLLRGTNTSHVPVSLTGDEADFGRWAYQMVLGKANNLFTTGAHAFPTLYMFIQSIFIYFLGPTGQAIRLSSAFIGALTVGYTYLAGKTLFNHRVGAFAGIFLTFFHFHIHFSRLGLNNIWDGFWFVVVLGAFWEGWVTRKRSAFLLAGLGLGFSQYFYASSRVLPFILLIWILMLAQTDRPRFQKLLLEISLLFFAALVVVLPLALYFLAHPNAFFDPLRATNIFGIWERGGGKGFPTFWSFLFNQLRIGFLAYTSAPVVFFYDPGIPLLRSFSAIIFGFGLLVLVSIYRNAKTWLLLMWLIVIALLGALSQPTPSAQRYIAAAPALALIIGVGFAQISAWTEKSPSFKRKELVVKSISFIMLFSLVLIGIRDTTFYFIDYRAINYLQWENTFIKQSLAEHFIEIPGEWNVVYLNAEKDYYLSSTIMQYLNPHLKKDDLLPLTTPNLNSFSKEIPLIFVFLPEEEAYLYAIQQFYPNGEIIEERGVYGKPLYWLYIYQP